MDNRIESVTIGLRTHKFYAQAVICSALVSDKRGRAGVRRDQNIEFAIVEHIGIRGPSRHSRNIERGAHLRGHVGKFSSSEIMEEQWRLRVMHLWLHHVNILLNMPVGHKDIRPAVVVIVEEEATEPKRQQARTADLR